MKKLTEYISESLLDDEEDLINNTDIEFAKQFLEKNYSFFNCSYDIQLENSKVVVNIKDDSGFHDNHRSRSCFDEPSIRLDKPLKKLNNDLFEWGDKSDAVDLIITQNCYLGKDLIGFPKIVDTVELSKCPNLETLKGCPIFQGFLLDNCPKLKNLKGLPDPTLIQQRFPGGRGSLQISYCPLIKDLNGLNTSCGGIKIYAMDSLKTLEGLKMTSNVSYLSIFSNNNLESLDCEITPNAVVKRFTMDHCPKIKNLIGMPNAISVIVDESDIVNLEGCSDKVEELSCKKCDSLISLNGVPPTIKSITCSYSKNLEDISAVPSSCRLQAGGCKKIK